MPVEPEWTIRAPKKHSFLMPMLFVCVVIVGTGSIVLYGLYRLSPTRPIPAEEVVMLDYTQVDSYRTTLPNEASFVVVGEDAPVDIDSIKVITPVFEQPVVPPDTTRLPTGESAQKGVSVKTAAEKTPDDYVNEIGITPVRMPTPTTPTPPRSSVEIVGTPFGVSSVTTSDPEEVGEKKPIEIGGLVIGTPKGAGYILVYDRNRNREYVIHLVASTEVSIAGKRAETSVIRAGDMVTVKGLGYHGSDTFTAETVTIVGTDEIIPIL